MKPILGQFICIVVKNISNFAKMCLFAKITSQLRVVKNLQKNDRNVLGSDQTPVKNEPIRTSIVMIFIDIGAVCLFFCS